MPVQCILVCMGVKTIAKAPVRQDRYQALTCCIDVIRSNDEVFHKVVPPQRETHAVLVVRQSI